MLHWKSGLAMADGDFWNSIVAAHRIDDNTGDRPILTPDPLESEPESDEEDRLDGVFSPQFVKTTGVHTYMRKCQEFNVVPVQQFISMMDRDVVSLKHRGVGSVGGMAIFECLRENSHIQALDMVRMASSSCPTTVTPARLCYHPLPAPSLAPHRARARAVCTIGGQPAWVERGRRVGPPRAYLQLAQREPGPQDSNWPCLLTLTLTVTRTRNPIPAPNNCPHRC